MIRRITIRNFRSLQDVTVDLDPLTVLIGRSGTGKSNFVQAMRFFRDSLTSRSVNYNQPGGNNSVFHVKSPTEPMVYDLTFAINDLGKEFRYRLAFDPKKVHYEEQLDVDGNTLFHRTGNSWAVTPNVHNAPQPKGIMLGAIPGLQESTFAYVALRSGIGCYDFPSDVLTGKGNGPGQDAGFADHGENFLYAADRILADLSKAHAWKRIVSVMKVINRSITSLTLNVPTPDRIDIGHQLNGTVLSLDARSEAEGFRRYLAQLLALYQNPPKQTLVFEHPESGLHPGALSALAEEFKECPREGRGQVILTTHSPQLLDYFPVESIRVVDIDHLSTRIDRLAPEQASAVKDRLLFPGELLTADPARLPEALDGVKG